MVTKTNKNLPTDDKQVELAMPLEAVARPSVVRVARRQSVTLDNRSYFAQELVLYDGKEVKVEYDLHDDAHAWISTLDCRHICTATITERKGVLAPATSKTSVPKAQRVVRD